MKRLGFLYSAILAIPSMSPVPSLKKTQTRFTATFADDIAVRMACFPEDKTRGTSLFTNTINKCVN